MSSTFYYKVMRGRRDIGEDGPPARRKAADDRRCGRGWVASPSPVQASARSNEVVERRASEELKPKARLSEAAGSLHSPAAILLMRCGLTPARWTVAQPCSHHGVDLIRQCVVALALTSGFASSARSRPLMHSCGCLTAACWRPGGRVASHAVELKSPQ